MKEISAQYHTADDGKGGSVSSSVLKATEVQARPPKNNKRGVSSMSSGGDGSPSSTTKEMKRKGDGFVRSVINSFGGEEGSVDPLMDGLLRLGKQKEEREDEFRKSQMALFQALAEQKSERSGGGSGGGGGSSSGSSRPWWSGQTADQVATWASANTPTSTAVIEWLCTDAVAGDDIADLEIADLLEQGIKRFEAKRFLRAVDKAGQ
jgi:hypothetical protein